MHNVTARRMLTGLIVTVAALISLSTGSALAAAIVKTGTATGITATTAMVSGTITATNADTAYSFVYGTSKSYTSNSKPVVAKVGTNTVTATLSGLQPNTLYHFELVADDATVEPVQIATGGDATFTTLKAPVATTEGATAITKTSAVLHGLANPTGPAAYAFQYGTSSSYSAQTATGTIAAGAHQVSTAITDLKPGTVYHYRLVVVQVSALGAYYDVTSVGGDRTFKTRSSRNAARFGKVVLRSRRLKDRDGKVRVHLRCRGPRSAHCAGRIHLRVTIGTKSVRAGSRSFRTRAHRNFSVTIRLPRKVAAAAKHHTLHGRLTGTFSTHQHKLKRKITIRG